MVTVDYTAGVNGYAETRTKEAGKVTMKAVPAWDGPLAGVEEASGAVASWGEADEEEEEEESGADNQFVDSEFPPDESVVFGDALNSFDPETGEPLYVPEIIKVKTCMKCSFEFPGCVFCNSKNCITC